jgi:hypothetical protein
MKKLFLVAVALFTLSVSASEVVKKNEKKITNEPLEIKIVRLTDSTLNSVKAAKWSVICKDGNKYYFETNSESWDQAIATGNAICSSMGL